MMITIVTVVNLHVLGVGAGRHWFKADSLRATSGSAVHGQQERGNSLMSVVTWQGCR